MTDEQAVLYEVTDEGVGVVTLNRPDKANSQTPAMLDELNDVLMGAAADRAVKVIVLQANGKHFSAGHDISGEGRREEDAIDLKVEGLAGIYEWETKRYIGYSRAWRDIRKPTIAAVQGQCIAGGLLLCWPMDIIIAADNAKFSDPVVRMGIGGVEYHGHTWELGPRKAKEWLFTASQFTAAEAEKFGMVNHVVPLDELREFTMAMAGRIAGMNAFALGPGQAGGQPDPGRAGLLRRDPVGVRHPLHRPRPRPVGQRLSDPGRPRPDEAVDEGRVTRR